MLKKYYKYYIIFKSNDGLDPLLFSSFSNNLFSSDI